MTHETVLVINLSLFCKLGEIPIIYFLYPLILMLVHMV